MAACDHDGVESVSVTADDGVPLHVGVCGAGADVVVLSGGLGCVHYLAREELAPAGFRCWFPDPRGVGRSAGGAHHMSRAIADLEDIRHAIGADRWIGLGHSWGSDLAVRYALDRPQRVRAVVGIAGHGFHRDREWSAEYEAGRASTEDPVDIDFVPQVHASLWGSFKHWIHEPTLWRRLADCAVPMQFIAAGDDIRPSWPLQQLAELVPGASYDVVDGVVHDFWFTRPQLWRSVCTEACRQSDSVSARR